MSNDLGFIAENIYVLKQEYGISIIVGSKSTVSNLSTGVKTTTKQEFPIKWAICLPYNYRQFFARQHQNRKEGYLETGDRQILIDISDVPAGKNLPEINGYIIVNGVYSDITKIEKYDAAYIVFVKNIPGMPIL